MESTEDSPWSHLRFRAMTGQWWRCLGVKKALGYGYLVWISRFYYVYYVCFIFFMMVIENICIHDYTCIKYHCISSGHAWCKVDSKNICNTGRLKTRKIICQLFSTCNCMKLSENRVQPRSHPLVNHYCSYSAATLGGVPCFQTHLYEGFLEWIPKTMRFNIHTWSKFGWFGVPLFLETSYIYVYHKWVVFHRKLRPLEGRIATRVSARLGYREKTCFLTHS